MCVCVCAVYYKSFHNIGFYERVCQAPIHLRVYDWLYAHLTNDNMKVNNH